MMPWDVRLQDERGEPVIREDAFIEFGTIPDGTRFTLLHCIDPYDDTCFNSTQMDDFLADWDKLDPTGEQREQWQLVRTMAIRCQRESNLYLRFIGD
jgi:hypothetical protein